jgi:ribonuclease P protein component
LQKKYRLRRREDFRKVFRTGRSVANREFVVYTKPKKTGTIRLGISISRRVGNAVRRNRIKRQMKEITREWIKDISSNEDIIVIVRKPVSNMNYLQIQSSLRHVLGKARVLKNTSSHKKDKL